VLQPLRKAEGQTASLCQEKPTDGHIHFFLSAVLLKFNKRIL